MKGLGRGQRPKKNIRSMFRPNQKGKLPHVGKDGKITNQRGAFGG